MPSLKNEIRTGQNIPSFRRGFVTIKHNAKMNNYAFASITINGREVEIKDILGKTASSLSKFESSTFSFIQNWFGPLDTFIQPTSGSTGIPKPITITRKQMIASAQLTQQALELGTNDTSLVCLDTDYIAGKMMLVRSFVTGMKIIAVNPSLNPFAALPLNLKIDFVAMVPLQVHEVIRSAQGQLLNSVKNIIVGGAPLSVETMENLSCLSGRIFETYGMTETVSHIALRRINGPSASEYFTTLPGIKIDTDKRGCLEISAPYLDDTITTNDIIEIKEDTKFKWLGRWDNIINSGGVKIIPEKVEGEIQKLFNKLKIENKFFISSRPDPALGSKLILLIEGSLRGPIIENIKSSLHDHLSPYEIPKEFFVNVDFVFTRNEKIIRSETMQKFGILNKNLT